MRDTLRNILTFACLLFSTIVFGQQPNIVPPSTVPPNQPYQPIQPRITAPNQTPPRIAQPRQPQPLSSVPATNQPTTPPPVNSTPPYNVPRVAMNDATSSVSNGNIPISAQPVSSDPNITRSVSIPVTNVVPGTVPVQPFYATQPLPPIQPNQPTPPPAPREPFTLTAAQEQELDAFLDRWEQHSLKIQRLEMSFLKYYFHDTTREQQTPTYITQGSFNYIKPDRVLYSIEGAFDQTTRKVDNSKYQEKWLYDGRSIHEYNFNVKEVVETPLPPEYRGKGIADSPLPMIFGAKKDEMKRRYWMRLVTEPKYANEQIWIEIYPRWRDDALEFRSLEMRVNNQTLVPIGFRKYDTGIARNDYAFFDVKINSGLDKLIDVMTKLFKSDVPQGWKHVVRELNEPTASLIATPTQPAPSQPNPQVVNEYKPSQPPQQIDLYDPEAKRTQPIYR